VIHLVVTCTGTKYIGPGLSIADAVTSLGNRRISICDLYGEWKSLLMVQLQATEGLRRARDLYRGATWQSALDAYNEIAGPRRLWIISCGFGLLSEDDYVCWYAATFKSGKPDSLYERGRFNSGAAIEVNRK